LFILTQKSRVHPDLPYFVKFSAGNFSCAPSSLIFLPNAALSIACLIGLPRRAYGQITVFSNLPVKPGSLLRANRRFFKSARKTRLPLTGKSTFFQICP